MKETSFTDFLKILLKEKRIIIISFLLFSIAGVVTSFLMKEEFTSKSRFYIINNEIFNPKLFFNADKEIPKFGTKDDADRVLVISKSAQIEENILQEFNLYDDWKLDTSTLAKKSMVSKLIQKHIKSKKGEGGEIIIEVNDYSADRASKIANFITNQINVLNKKSIIQDLVEQKNIYLDNIKKINEKLDYVQIKMNKLIKDYNIQSEVNEACILTYSSNSNPTIVTELSKDFTEYYNLQKQYNNSSRLLNQLNSILNNNIDSISVIENATPNYKKTSPIRWLVCCVFSILGIVISISYVLIKEFVKTNF